MIRHHARLLALSNDWADVDTEDFLLRDGSRSHAARLESEYFVWSMDLVAGRATYCLPSTYYIESADAKFTTDPARYPVPLALLVPSDMAAYPQWRTDGGVALGTVAPTTEFGPVAMVIESMSSFTLYPTPTVSITKGLTIRGFGWLEDALWPNDDDECPLIPASHDALTWKVAALIAAHRENFARAQYLEGQYNDRSNTIEIKRVTMTEALRQRYNRLLPGSAGALPVGGAPWL
jgi:hypothetical protein